MSRSRVRNLLAAAGVLGSMALACGVSACDQDDDAVSINTPNGDIEVKKDGDVDIDDD